MAHLLIRTDVQDINVDGLNSVVIPLDVHMREELLFVPTRATLDESLLSERTIREMGLDEHQ
jgi:hypothetical protein